MYQLGGKKNLADSVAIYGRGQELFRPPMYVPGWKLREDRIKILNMLYSGSRIYLLLLLHQLNQQFLHVFFYFANCWKQ
jgi:hypothetical protein